MTDTPPKPKRRRWRWLAVGMVLIVGCIPAACLLWWPKIDPRIVGVWRLENSGTRWTFGADGDFNSSGTSNDPKRWWVESDSLNYSYPADLTIKSISSRVFQRLKGRPDLIIPRHAMRIVEVSANRIVVEQPYGSVHSQVLLRLPD